MDTTPSKRKADESLDGGSPNKGSDQPSIAHKKTKGANSCSVETPKDTTIEESPLHIPAPVWGHVLDYMPYGDVRSALLVGKMFANEAVQYVHTLSFMKSCQLDVPSARRFPNVQHVNILSLLSVDENDADRTLCESTSMRMVPVLTAFSKLKSLFAGGFHCYKGRMYRRYYNPLGHTGGPDNHMELARAMVRSFLGAIQSKLLPTTLESMDGITEKIYDLGFCTKTKENGNACSSCRRIIAHFPFADLARFPFVGVCVDETEYFRLLTKRPGAKELIKKHSTEKLTDFLNESVDYFDWHDSAKNEDEEEEAEKLTKRIECLGVRELRVQFLFLSSIRQLDALIDVGFDPKAISRSDLYEQYGIGIPGRLYDVFAKTTFDALVSRGFPFYEADLIVLDETKEPALRGLSRQIQDN